MAPVPSLLDGVSGEREVRSALTVGIEKDEVCVRKLRIVVDHLTSYNRGQGWSCAVEISSPSRAAGPAPPRCLQVLAHPRHRVHRFVIGHRMVSFGLAIEG